MPRKLTAETPQKFAFNRHTQTSQKNPQTFQEVPHNPNINPVKGELPNPSGLKTKNEKLPLNFRPKYSALTLNHTKIRNMTNQLQFTPNHLENLIRTLRKV